MYLTVEEARSLLPKIGDTCWEVPTVNLDKGSTPPLQRCTVVEVNRDHLWYMVESEDGIRESYKAPKLKPSSKEGAGK